MLTAGLKCDPYRLVGSVSHFLSTNFHDLNAVQQTMRTNKCKTELETTMTKDNLRPRGGRHEELRVCITVGKGNSRQGGTAPSRKSVGLLEDRDVTTSIRRGGVYGLALSSSRRSSIGKLASNRCRRMSLRTRVWKAIV